MRPTAIVASCILSCILLCMLMCILMIAAPSEAASKTAVTVKFVLSAYPREFDPGQVQAIERQAAERIVMRLGEHTRFLTFTTQDGNLFTLTVTLRPRSAAERPDAPGEVVFQFSLVGPRVRADPVYVTFRPANDISRVPPVDQFIEEVDLRLSQHASGGTLVQSLITVPIATTAEMRPSLPGWLLPYQRNELCLEVDSELTIEHVVRVAGGGSRRPQLVAIADGDVDGRILGSPQNPADFQQIAGLPPADVSVDLIWVKKYQARVGCSPDFPR
jgi:hypothetical protein